MLARADKVIKWDFVTELFSSVERYSLVAYRPLSRVGVPREVFANDQSEDETCKMNLPLPEANSATAAEVREWLDRFAACVREVDYAAARPFWHPDIVIFGTYQELVKSLSAWTERQWDNVWPRTAEFRFDLANTMIMAAPDGAMAVAIAPWTSTGFHEDGTAFDRPGRATIVLARQPDGRWLGVHSHMSLARGVPQDSHGKRAVKGR
jgi:ketosteroid isomerase-like protein